MKTVLLLSGGMDSATLLYDLLNDGDEVVAVSFDYGQRHSRELDAASELTRVNRVKHYVFAIPKISGSSLTFSSEVPHGHYAEESMKSTVVPNRNMILLAHATSLAIQLKADRVAYACHAGDHTIYPDCRPRFVNSLRDAISVCDWVHIDLYTPFLLLDKKDIAKLGRRLGVPFDKTWTCYEGGKRACGKCGACVERDEALQEESDG